MSARRRLCLTLLGVLALSGISAYAVFAAGGKPDFSIAASPSSQTVSQGQATTFTVTVTRANGFTGPVSLAASGLPSGAITAREILQVICHRDGRPFTPSFPPEIPTA